MTSQEALSQLKEGNQRYVAGNLQHPHSDVNRRESLTGGQQPFAVILSCADSRVVPELVFDQGIGDIFVIRVAGNIANDDVTGSIEYAVKHLGSKLVVVLGHEKCGAVGASLGDEDPGGHISAIVKKIKPSVEEAKALDGDLLTNAVKTNAKNTAKELAGSKPTMAPAVASDGVEVVSAYYKLETGEVEFL
ncbi:carbonic anhydrase [Marinoscillum furvescens]|uniref:Carbonic anhydrase n=1 Tax=Marinoscillum furvescens DSM 4134 TaxID=1122208 RepID=A0A3D9L2N8_MARFU|nr:carbonic anhydrase [Marinoscillum furvescens]RED97957.1 carbonic anhydrase [Marinoscillum furvescens DSM 4134]